MNTNAISILKEMVDAKIIAEPQYNVKKAENGFEMEVKVGDITATASAANKKMAKHACASSILLKLKPPHLKDFTSTCNNDSFCQFNAIGALNEKCAGAGYPDYALQGLDGSLFVMECKYLKFSTFGKSSNKKQAKQLAAMEMLNLLKPSDIKKMKEPEPLETDTKVLEIIKDLKSNRINAARTDDQKSITSLFETLKIEKKQDMITIDERSKDELEKQLLTLCISYDVNMVQKHPIVMSLHVTVRGDQKYVFLHSDKTSHSECHIQLLKRAIAGLEVLLQ